MEPQAVVVDASVWLSNLLPGDANHRPAALWLDRHIARGGRLLAPVLIVAEVAGAVSRLSQDVAAARAAAAHLHSTGILDLISLDQPLVDEAANAAAEFGLRGADAFYVALAKLLYLPLLTFDREQLDRPRSTIDTIRP